MRIVSFDGYDFATNDYIAGVDWLWGQWQVIHNQESRLDAPALLTGGTVTTRAIPVQFAYNGASTWETAALALMARLDPMNTTPRTLAAELNDGTDVSCDAVVQVVGASTADDDANWIEVVFITADPYWTETSATTDGPDTINAGSPSTVIVNGGATDVAPVIERSAPTSQFLSAESIRQRITVTNTGELPLEREAFSPLIAYTSLNWSYNKLLKDGTYHPMTTMTDFGVGGAYMLFWSEITVDAGESETYDLLSAYNEAVFPTGLSSFGRFDGNYCALDLGYDFVSNATAATANTISDSGEAWTVDRWAGACVFIYGGTGAGQARLITANTATQLTVSRNWSTTPDTTSDFQIIGSGWYLDGGIASSGAASSLTDSAQSWDPDTLIGGTISIIAGTGSGQSKTITDNTASVITIDGTWSVTPNSTSVYRIERFGYHRYYVEQVKHSENQRGGWQQNKRFSKPSKILWGRDVINGWERFTLLDNNDDFNQSRTCPINLGGSDIDYFPILDADRRRGQDRRLEEEGQGDGVAIYHPFGYSGIRFDYQIKNPNSASGATDGICKFLLAGREAGGDEFEPYIEDDQLQAALTNVAAQYVNLTAYGSPEQLYMGVQPADDVEVSRDAAESDTATVRWYETLRLWVDIAGKLSWSVGSQDAIIPIQDEIRIGNYALQIGMRDGQRLYTKASGQTLHFDCAAARAWIEEGGVEVEDITYAVTPVIYDGADYQVADRWPVLAPGNNTVTCDGDPWASDGAFTLTFTFSEKVYG